MLLSLKEKVKINKWENWNRKSPYWNKCWQASDFVVSTQCYANPSKPVFINFDKDIQKIKYWSSNSSYVPNTDNSIFRLKYRYKVNIKRFETIFATHNAF
jgi:hypothetical protein